MSGHDGEERKAPFRWTEHLRLYFITGLVALAPLAITVYILWALFSTIDGWLAGLYGRVSWLNVGGRPIPGLGLASIIAIILVAGVLARNFIGHQLVRAVEGQLLRVPMVRSIYSASKQLSRAFLGNNRAIFREVVLIPFPTRELRAIGFVTADAPPEVCAKLGGGMVSVFLPTTPNPTSGYLLMVRREDVVPLAMSVEEAVKLVISGGAVYPAGPLAGHPIAESADGEPKKRHGEHHPETEQAEPPSS